jgi:hypothetical protein
VHAAGVTYDCLMIRHLSSLLPGVILASGCVSTVNIDAEDTSQFSNLGASIPLNGDDNTRLRFKATRVDGSFDQRLDAGERIHLEDSTFDGPDLVDGDLELTYYSIAIGGGKGFDSAGAGGLRTETYFGISQTRFDLEMESGNRRLQADDDTVEFYMQWAAIAPINDSLDFGFSWALSVGREFSGISEIDLMLEFDVAEHLSITGGYRWFEYQYDSGGDDSNLEVDFRGPFLGIRVPF